MALEPTFPEINDSDFKECDWKQFYGDVEEAIPSNSFGYKSLLIVIMLERRRLGDLGQAYHLFEYGLHNVCISRGLRKCIHQICRSNSRQLILFSWQFDFIVRPFTRASSGSSLLFWSVLETGKSVTDMWNNYRRSVFGDVAGNLCLKHQDTDNVLNVSRILKVSCT